MKIISPSFEHDAVMPKQFTCEGENVSPELHFEAVPEGAKSLALVMDDPDATGGTVFTHWMIWNIPSEISILSSNEILPGTVEGVNDFGKKGYGGPCPARGKPHHYRFRLYAITTMLELSETATKAELEDAISPHLLAETELRITYQR